MRPVFIYSPRYEINLEGHVFPTEKYRLIRRALLESGDCLSGDFIEPPEPTRDDLLLVHTPAYLDDLDHARPTARTLRSELPVTRTVIDSFRLCGGGSTLTARLASERGAVVHLGGGFHHAFADHAEGFCYINDVAVAARAALRDRIASRVLIVDVDLHQGNGTANIFRNDESVFTFSIHQENNYPPKERSDRDIGLLDRTGDTEYLSLLEHHLPDMRDRFRPDLVLYVAGADPFEGDALGGLSLTIDGLRRRDGLVFDTFLPAGIPVATVLAGGYAREQADTIAIHMGTCLESVRAAGSWKGGRK